MEQIACLDSNNQTASFAWFVSILLIRQAYKPDDAFFIVSHIFHLYKGFNAADNCEFRGRSAGTSRLYSPLIVILTPVVVMVKLFYGLDHMRRIQSLFEGMPLASFYDWIQELHAKYKKPVVDMESYSFGLVI